MFCQRIGLSTFGPIFFLVTNNSFPPNGFSLFKFFDIPFSSDADIRLNQHIFLK